MSTDDDGGGGKPPAKGESRGDPLENFSKQVNSLLQPLWELMAKLAEMNGDPDSLRVLLELFRKLSEEFSEAQQRAMILEQQGINDPEQQAKEEQAKEKTASRKRKAEEGIASRRIKQQVALVDPSSLVLGGVLTTKPLGYVAETVWFGTNRKKNLSGTIGQVTFDNGRPKMANSQITVPRMENVTLGSVTVHIREEDLRGIWEKGIDFVSRSDKSIYIDSTKILKSYAAVFEEMVLSPKANTDGDVLLFIHGYNVPFEGAAMTAARLSYEIGLPTAFFSWPSEAELKGYTADEACISACEHDIETFLTKFLEDRSDGKVHVIAHSMGNRGLVRALQRIQAGMDARPDNKRFGRVVFAAPDVDAQ
jgi:hypothetical protein